ncbi:11665_t:CDS:2 [Funneliformis geosporum]|uniref:1397_t:CDS:1 n=1 Tax=Funneliformis geosporum TaxID=1117311 RepID=A0A9W4WVN1_9GLOM|nr:11665_t:CDS:2 [Funneliformis geosporum]CAI2182408.1 1397_t:CDS:2 [Funneliformis geosporum]
MKRINENVLTFTELSALSQIPSHPALPKKNDKLLECILLMAYLGLRVSEAIKFSWQQVKVEDKEAFVVLGKDVAQYLLSLDPQRKYFTKNHGNFRLNSLLHICQILYCAKSGKMLFKEDMLAYPPSWYKLSLKQQEKLATIMGNQAIKNKRASILKLYQKVQLTEPNRKLLNNYCRSFTG